MIHEHSPGQDYYNWSARCLSAGSPYNPHKVRSLGVITSIKRNWIFLRQIAQSVSHFGNNWNINLLDYGSIFCRLQVYWDPDHPEWCSGSKVTLCRLGDLSRHETLQIAGRKKFGPKLTRKLFTDPILPLTGSTSILGKSLVIYDDHGPVARGERLACSM